METKKSNKANLEKGKKQNLLLGLAVALSCLFVSFEWQTEASVPVHSYYTDGWGCCGYPYPDDPYPTFSTDTCPPGMIAYEINIIENEVETLSQEIMTSEDDPYIPIRQTTLQVCPQKEIQKKTTHVSTNAEQMPEFPGGIEEMLKFIRKTMKYPQHAYHDGIEGRVVCTFIVNEDGSITDIEVIRSVETSLDKEAIRIIESMPKWEPGKDQGKTVAVRYMLPLVFRRD